MLIVDELVSSLTQRVADSNRASKTLRGIVAGALGLPVS